MTPHPSSTRAPDLTSVLALPPKGDEGAPRAAGLLDTRVRLLLGVQACYGFSFSCFFLLPKFLSTELRASADDIGTVSSTAAAFAVLSVPLVGWLLDRAPRRPLIVAGALVGAAASLGFVWVDHLGPLVYALRALQGVSFALVFSANSTVMADLAPPQRLGEAIGYVGLASLATNALAPLVAEPLANAHGWTPVFVLSAAAGGAAALLALGGHEAERSAPSPGSDPDATGRSTLHHAVVLAATVLMGAAFGVMFTFVAPLALERDMTEVRSFFFAYTLTAVAARTLLRNVADRRGRRATAIVAFSMYALVVMSAALLRRGWLEPLGAGLGLAHGLLYPALNALAVEGSPEGRRGSVMSTFNGAFSLGSAGAVVLLGYVAEAHGYPPTFVAAGLGALAAALALAVLPERRSDRGQWKPRSLFSMRR